MRIVSFQIQNYKSFRRMEEVRLTPSFNVVVGENNVGKTALIESLSLRAGANPHRSLKTAPTRDSPLLGVSSITITFDVPGGELLPFLRRMGAFYFPTFHSEASRAASDLTNMLASASLELETKWQNGGLIDAEFPVLPTPPPLFAILQVAPSGAIEPAQNNTVSVNANHRFERQLAEFLKTDRIFLFNAERYRVGLAAFGTSTVLQASAANLPEVLANLQGRNPVRFQRLVSYLRTIFPAVRDVAIHSREANQVEILIWPVDPTTERDDLAIRLAESGTGVGQVLAMLYVVVAAEAPEVILIDEPQSFLHPGAVRKLFEILGNQKQKHQYIVTTHSPTALTSVDLVNLLRLTIRDGETSVQSLDASEAQNLRLVLADIGARLSDVFGADAILWVEGPTEEVCFPKILQKLTTQQLRGTAIIGVMHTAEFEARRSEATVELYRRLSTGRGLLPPAVGFVFDREGRSDRDRTDLTRRNNVFFLPRRMYENYLLNPQAIAGVASGIQGFREKPLNSEEIQSWLDQHRTERKYFTPLPVPKDGTRWMVDAHGSKLLMDLFNDLSDTRVRYDKVRDGVALTEWILGHAPEELREVAQEVERALTAPADAGT
jgi:putative AbiEii toxin of type IV toxin-antitoxin system/AAA ATPase-like protein